jgi:hypothetical protein
MGVKRFAVAMMALSLMFTGACGDDGDDDDAAETTSTTEAPSTTLAAAEKAEAEAAITTVFEAFFNGALSFEERASHLEDGDELQGLVEEQASILGAQARNTTGTVKTIKLLDESSAEVTFDVLLSGVPALRDGYGLAVLVDDEWKVSRITLCDLLRLAGQQPRECQNVAEEAGG